MPPFLTLHHPRAAEAHYRNGLWRQETFYALLRQNAAITPDMVALVDGTRSFTWAALLDWADGLAADLSSFGLGAGDRICGWMSNRAELIVTMLAASRQGFAFNPSLHRGYTALEVGRLLQSLDARALVMEEGWGAAVEGVTLTAILAGIASLKVVYIPDIFPRGGPNLMPWETDPDKIAYLAHTSGTTGEPKCVMHSDNTLLANARELVRDWRHDRATVIYSLSPLSHHIAWVGFGQWLLTGCRYVIDNPPPGRTTLDWIVASGATYVMGAPTEANDLLAEEATRRSGLGAVKTFCLAGAPIPPALCEGLIALGVTPKNVYGMTENSSHHYTLPRDRPEVLINSCGRGGRAYEVRIFDADDPVRELPPGEIGQIGGRGAALMLGYFNDQRATERSFNRDGWFLSGDLGMLDREGNLRLVGRLKDTIIRGGYNICCDPRCSSS